MPNGRFRLDEIEDEPEQTGTGRYRLSDIGPTIPKGNQPATLPKITNEDLKKVGKGALKYLPAAAATAGALTQPQFWPAVGMAALGGGVGSLAEQGIEKATGMPEAPESIEESLKRTGKEAALQGVTEMGGRLVAKPIEWVAAKFTPRRLYQGALMPQTGSAMPPEKRAAIIETGLRERIPVSEEGFNLTGERIEALSQEISNRIKGRSQQLGPVIDPQDVAKRLDDVTAFFKKQVNDPADLAEIETVRKNFLTKHSREVPFTKIQPGMQGGYVPAGKGTARVDVPMTLAEAQAEKQGTYAINRKKYGKLGPAQAEAEKAEARGLKEMIEKFYPELKQLNARDGALIELDEQLGRFTAREGNKKILGLIPATIGAGAGIFGGVLSDHPTEGTGLGGALALTLLALENPNIKSKLAIALARAAKTKAGRVAQKFTPRRVVPTAARAAGATLGNLKPMLWRKLASPEPLEQ